MLGAIFGGLLGGVTVILLAPGSGEETRSAVKEKLAALLAELKSSIEERRVELESELELYKKVN